jgi:predicted AAA+ superfamily ATPase
MDRSGGSDKIARLEKLLGRIKLSGTKPGTPESWAHRWHRGRLEPVVRPDIVPLDSLIGVERSVRRLRSNVGAFTRGDPALDTLLYGDRGTGKSSAVRGLLGELGPAGLRLVEVRPHHLDALPDVMAALRDRPGRFVLVCDDLGFEEGDPAYRELKSALDGGLERRPENVLIVATSNRRHLVPERSWENLSSADRLAEDLHPEETREDKMGLADRFGLLVPFFGFNRETFLRIVDHYAQTLGLSGRLQREQLHARAIRFALERGGSSGRTARQVCILALQELAEGPL